MHVFFCLLLTVGFIQFGIAKEEGLYKPGDNVTFFNGDNLIPTLSNGTSLWLVEYYSSWCGHCQEFAPTIKALAKDIAGWRWLFNIAAINCGNTAPSGEENFLTCHRDPLWVLDYPEFRFYSTLFNGTSMGESYQGPQELKALRKAIVDYVDSNIHDIKWNHDNNKPNMVPITYDEFLSYSTPVFWSTLTYKMLYVALVFENKDSYMGKEIVLDTSSCTNILVRRVNTDDEDGKLILSVLNIKENELPMVMVMTNEGTNFPINVIMKTRSFYTYQLTKLSGVGQPAAKLQISESVAIPEDDQTPLVNYKDVDRNSVYLADIESALHYALSIEVSSVKLLEGRKLEALTTFLKIFAEIGDYFPSRKSTINFLSSLYNWVKQQHSIPFDVWSDRVNERTDDSFLPTTNKLWVGCKASQPSLRGYPCSLWTLFHTLTVAASNAGISEESLVPNGMYAYITNFFGCRDCRQNFKKEFSKIAFKDTSENNEAVLWLWEVHNSVNKRLHFNSSTEDPEFPKLQFPSTEMCPTCTDPSSGEIIEQEIVRFLMHRYSMQNIKLSYLDVNEFDFYDNFEVAAENLTTNGSEFLLFKAKNLQPDDYVLRSELGNETTMFYPLQAVVATPSNSNELKDVISEKILENTENYESLDSKSDVEPITLKIEQENIENVVDGIILEMNHEDDTDIISINKESDSNEVDNNSNEVPVFPTQMESPPLGDNIKIEFEEPQIRLASENFDSFVPTQLKIAPNDGPVVVEFSEENDYEMALQLPQPFVEADLQGVNSNSFLTSIDNDVISMFMAEKLSDEIAYQVNDFLNEVVIIPDEVIVKMDKEIEINHGNSDKESIKEKLEKSFHFEQQRFHPRALGSNRISNDGQSYNRTWDVGFSPLDMSLCLMLWLTTIVGSVFLYSVIRMRRHYSKRKDYKRMM